MSYIVTNMTTGEELTALDGLNLAIALCERMVATGDDPYWVVIEHKVVYRPNETPKVHQPPRGEDIAVVMSPQAQAKIDSDPKLAELTKEVTSRIRQALDGIATGRFADADEAMRSIGAEKIEFDGEDDE